MHSTMPNIFYRKSLYLCILTAQGRLSYCMMHHLMEWERMTNCVCVKLIVICREILSARERALAIVLGLKKKFHLYLNGQGFMIYTDVQPLKHLFNNSCPIPVMASLHIQRCPMILGSYHCWISYKTGSYHGNAYGFSRLPLSEAPGRVPMLADVVLVLNQIESTTVEASQIESCTERDPTLSKMKKYCMTAWCQGVRRATPAIHEEIDGDLHSRWLTTLGIHSDYPTSRTTDDPQCSPWDTPQGQSDEKLSLWLCVVA